MSRDDAAALARTALRRELGIGDGDDRDEIELGIELIWAEPVDWPDGSLGCPEKGMAYPQAITPGWRLTFRARGREWRVHAGGRRALVCQNK